MRLLVTVRVGAFGRASLSRIGPPFQFPKSPSQYEPGSDPNPRLWCRYPRSSRTIFRRIVRAARDSQSSIGLRHDLKHPRHRFNEWDSSALIYSRREGLIRQRGIRSHHPVAQAYGIGTAQLAC
jgi:hypothetical protein